MADTVRAFLKNLPANYPERLRNITLQSADELYRAAEIVKKSGIRATGLRALKGLNARLQILALILIAARRRAADAIRGHDDSGAAGDRWARRRHEQRDRDGESTARSPASAPSSGTPTIDLGNLTLLPGFIDTHVHIGWHFDDKGRYHSGPEPAEQAALYGAENAYVTLMAGFTTVQSVGAMSDKPLRDAINRGVLPGPAHPVVARPDLEPEMATDQIREQIRKLKAEAPT